jgi:hypothetical protein
MRPNYFYQIEFADGRVIRREYQTRTMAEAVAKSMVQEMILFNVQSITHGKMS